LNKKKYLRLLLIFFLLFILVLPSHHNTVTAEGDNSGGNMVDDLQDFVGADVYATQYARGILRGEGDYEEVPWPLRFPIAILYYASIMFEHITGNFASTMGNALPGENVAAAGRNLIVLFGFVTLYGKLRNFGRLNLATAFPVLIFMAVGLVMVNNTDTVFNIGHGLVDAVTGGSTTLVDHNVIVEEAKELDDSILAYLTIAYMTAIYTIAALVVYGASLVTVALVFVRELKLAILHWLSPIMFATFASPHTASIGKSFILQVMKTILLLAYYKATFQLIFSAFGGGASQIFVLIFMVVVLAIAIVAGPKALFAFLALK